MMIFADEEPGHPPHYGIAFSAHGRVRLSGEDAAQVDNSFAVGDHVIAGAFQEALPENVADLVDVALAVYISDRLCRRGSALRSRYLHGWARHLHITVPVRNPSFWCSPAVSSKLLDVLGYFTEDVWEFEFEQRPMTIRGAFQQSLFPPDLAGAVRVALFSGGLDSLAGLCAEILNEAGETFVLFAGSTNNFHKGTQNRLATQLALKSRAPILQCVVPFGFKGREPRAGNRDEPTQRSRGFVHTALGAATAIMAGSDQLAIYENGVGAINLPYSGAQVGTHLTRAAHPVALALMSDFLSTVLGQAFRVELPFLGMTKGEICKSIPLLGAEELVAKTNSCDRFLRRERHQCGVCTSCVLRRQSLYAAGLREFDDSAEYFYDIYSNDIGAMERKLFGYRMMVNQVNRAEAALRRSDPWVGLVSEFPPLLEVALQMEQDGHLFGSANDTLVGLYSRYVSEWRTFPARPPRQPLYTLHEHGATHGG